MTCNCGNGDTPEYYITLDGVGVDGYSPEVNVIDEDTASFKIEVINKSNTQETLAIPKLSYVSDQINNINTTIANLGNTYLTVNGSNAANPIILNHLTMGYQYGSPYINSDGNLYIRGAVLSLQATGDINLSTTGTSKAYYNNNEIATLNDIPSVPTVGNGTITIAQGGITKGTFTTNQSGNTTIDLDSGASNPLDITNTTTNDAIMLGINNNSKAYSNFLVGGTITVPIQLITDVTAPLTLTEKYNGLQTLSVNTMTGSDSITAGAAGLVPAPSAGDQDKFLKGDGTWDTVGGGGSSYTAGTGIDITNDTISVKNAQSFAKVTIANGYSTGEGLYGWLDDGSSTIPLVRVSDLDDVIIGDGGSKLVLHGDETRPSYFNGQTTSYLALYSDIPDVSSFVTSTSLATTLADYMDLSTNQTVGGNKTFTGTTYLRTTYICNASGTYFGRTRAVDDKFTFEAIGTNRSINLIPNGTGTLQYNGNEVQTTNKLVTSVDGSSTDSEYPSAKLFYDTVGDIETLINAL